MFYKRDECMLYEWRDCFSVGYAPIDDQHQKLFSISNELTDAALRSDGANETDLKKTIDELLNYVRDHFSQEEAMMHQSGFPDIVGHIVVHNAFLIEILNLENRVLTGDVGEIHAVAVALPKLVGDWLIDHIAIEDQKYASYVRKSVAALAV